MNKKVETQKSYSTKKTSRNISSIPTNTQLTILIYTLHRYSRYIIDINFFLNHIFFYWNCLLEF